MVHIVWGYYYFLELVILFLGYPRHLSTFSFSSYHCEERGQCPLPTTYVKCCILFLLGFRILCFKCKFLHYLWVSYYLGLNFFLLRLDLREMVFTLNERVEIVFIFVQSRTYQVWFWTYSFKNWSGKHVWEIATHWKCSKWQQSKTASGWRSSWRRSFGALRCETPAVRKSCGQKPQLNNIVSATKF